MKIKSNLCRSFVKKRLLLQIMKTFIFLLSTTVFSFNAEKSFSQEAVTIEKDELVKIDRVFKIIQKQTDLDFIYPNGLFKNKPKVQLKKGDIRADVLLKYVLNIAELDFEIFDEGSIIIKEKVSNEVLVQQQQYEISGTITDEYGQPLPGASIIEKGTSNGSQSDFDGNFSIDVDNENATLVISFLGFASQEIAIDGQKTINVSLAEDTSKLDAVIVTSLGISRTKKSLGYSITELKSDEINTVKDHNVASSLMGKVAGLNITTSGSMGAGSSIVIRGNNSLSGNSQALIVVDGIPINADGTNSGGSLYNTNVTGGGISDINASDIESISVLKGPNSAALYGSRAGNGVILITTKKGTNDSKIGITVNSNTTMDEVLQLPEFQNDYGQGTLGAAPTYNQENGVNTGLNTNLSWGSKMDGSPQPYFTGTNNSYTAQPNNVKSFFNTGVKSINSIAIQKGGENTTTRFSYTNNTTTGILPESELVSHNFNARASSQLSDKLSIDFKATYFSQEVNGRVRTGGEGIIPVIYQIPRNVDVNDLRVWQMANPSSDADYRVINATGLGEAGRANPFWMLENDIDRERRGRFFGFTKINYEFNDWLTGFVRVGTDITNVSSYDVRQPGHHWFPSGRLNNGSTKSGELNTDFLLTATKDLSSDLNLVFNLGGNLSKRTFESLSVFGEDFKIKSKSFLNNTKSQRITEIPQQTKKVNSLYAAANFAYNGFLYVDLTARNDWSSTLPEDNRSIFYGSANAAVLLEDFIDIDMIDMFKLRGSIANVGNDTDPYQLVQTFNVPGLGFQGLTTLNAPLTRLNAKLKPENIQSSEFGIELVMFNNKLSLDLAVYNIKTTDMIFSVPVPAATGYSFFLENVGEVTNKGVEFSLGFPVWETSNFKWTSSLYYSANENKLVSLIDGIETLVYNNNNSGNFSVQAKVGGGIGDIYGTVWDKDANGNNLVNANGSPIASVPDKLLGNAQPDWMGGFSNTMTFGKWNVNFLIDGRFGGQIFSEESSYLDLYGLSLRSLQYRESGITLTGLDPDGSANAASITGQEYWESYAAIAENHVYKQDNIRLREFSVGYSFPGVSSMGIESAAIQIIGRNLFFFQKSAPDGMDPEAMLGTNIQGQGISSGNLPTTRNIGLNLTLKF